MNQVQKSSASTYPEVILPSKEQPGFVAAVVNPGDFYVQLAEQKAGLTELMTSLAATYNSPVSDIFVFMNPKLGEKCCTDKQGYRALIDTLENSTATVTFIHFGTSETVMAEELRYIFARSSYDKHHLPYSAV